MKKLISKLIHGNILPNPKDPYRSLKMPIYDTASFDFENSQALEDAFLGNRDAFLYSRSANPTITELQNRLQLFSGSNDCLCVSSGMAAISSVMLSICHAGDNIISTKYLFGNTYSLFTKTLHSVGIETRFADLEDFDALEKMIDSKTRAIFLEILTNPQLIIFDIKKLSQLADKYKILLIVDNTILTPYIFESSKYGIDVEIASTTKFISGGATSVGGAIMTYNSDKWQHIPKLKEMFDKFGKLALNKKLTKEVYRNMGCCLSPNNAYLQLLGLETITLRIDKICENTLQVAKYLDVHPKVEQIIYTSLEKSKYYDLAKEFFGLKSGPLINMELKSKSDCYAFMDALKMVRRGTNFCDNKSMIIHPHSTIYCEFIESDKAAMLVNDKMLRLSVGLEDAEDILEDIEQALSKI